MTTAKARASDVPPRARRRPPNTATAPKAMRARTSAEPTRSSHVSESSRSEALPGLGGRGVEDTRTGYQRPTLSAADGDEERPKALRAGRSGPSGSRSPE